MPDPTLRLALLQFAPLLGELRPNLDRVLDGTRYAAAAGAALVLAPEMCLTGWTLPDRAARVRLADQTASVAVPALAEAARQFSVTVVAGGPLPFSDAVANCAIALSPSGHRAVHRKLHLFGPEATWWTRGDGVEVVATARAVVGPLICYDGEFCEVPRMLRLRGASLMAVAATNMSPYERDQDLIFATRALENECVVAVCNRVGSEGDWHYFGRSLVADARGNVVAQAGAGEEVLLAEVTPAAAEPDPALSYITHRRPAIYRPICRGGRAFDFAAAPMTGRSGGRQPTGDTLTRQEEVRA